MIKSNVIILFWTHFFQGRQSTVKYLEENLKIMGSGSQFFALEDFEFGQISDHNYEIQNWPKKVQEKEWYTVVGYRLNDF